MKKWTKKIGAISMAMMLMGGSVATLASCGSGEDSDTFTIWVGSSVNSEFYNDYGENPTMQYLQKKFDIKLKFISPLVGKETDDFNKLIGSGSYPDMMDITFYTDVLADLYDDGYGAAMDLTQYIADYMPNYTRFMQENPELTKYAKVDGRYITLNNYNEALPGQWGGFMYRRDWLVKYDGNAEVADAEGNYKDGVKFPDGYLDENGYDNPLTIADWEYMFEIFEKSPDYKYAISLPSKGYHETGEIVAAFGVGGLWNLYEGETEGVYNVAKFGATTDNFRRYVETMSKWYQEGWLDPDFASNSSDMFYALDGGSITSGKVGLWYGTVGQVGDSLEKASTTEIPAIKGIDVWAAVQPKETVDSADPTVFYLDGQETSRRWIVTDAAKDKNLEKLFKMLDFLYSEEGSIIKYYGLSKAQWEEYDINTSIMTKYGLENGCYTWCDANGNEVAAGTEGALIKQSLTVLNASGDLAVATNGNYFFGLGYDDLGKAYSQHSERKLHAYNAWATYNNHGTVKNSLLGQMTSNEGDAYNVIQENIRTTLGTEIPKLIKNGVTNVSWNGFLGQLRTRKCDTNTAALQGLIDRLK